MKWASIITAILLYCTATFAGAEPLLAAYGGGLPPPIIGSIQQRFEGRVIGVRPNGGPCRNVEREVMINGRPEVARDFACQQPDGTWSTEFNYDVQVLTRRGNVIIVTVDPVSGRVLGVRR